MFKSLLNLISKAFSHCLSYTTSLHEKIKVLKCFRGERQKTTLQIVYIKYLLNSLSMILGAKSSQPRTCRRHYKSWLYEGE